MNRISNCPDKMTVMKAICKMIEEQWTGYPVTCELLNVILRITPDPIYPRWITIQTKNQFDIWIEDDYFVIGNQYADVLGCPNFKISLHSPQCFEDLQDEVLKRILN